MKKILAKTIQPIATKAYLKYNKEKTKEGKKMKQKQEGITIVTLVVTIVVLLILAAITIGSLTSDNGMIKEASSAKKAVERQALEEQIEIAIIKSEQKHRSPTLDQVIEEIEKIEHVTKVNKETGDIENDLGEPIKGKLDDYIKKDIGENVTGNNTSGGNTSSSNNTSGGNTSGGNTSIGNNTAGGEIIKPDVANVEITRNPSDIEIIERIQAIEFSIEATGEGTKTYQWYQNNTNSNKGGTLIVGATKAKYTISANEVTTNLNETYYYCIVTIKNGTATDTKTSTPAKLSVVAVAMLTKQPVEVKAIAGNSNVSFTVEVEAAGTLTYKWYKNLNHETTGGTEVATGSTYTIPANSVSNSLSGNYYYCVITQTYGSSTTTITSNAVNLFVVSPASITKHPMATSVKAGNSVTFIVTATGEGITGYQWYQNSTNSNGGGMLITGATSSTYTIPAAEVTAALNGKYYYCVVSQKYGEQTANQTSNVAILVVTEDEIEKAIREGEVLSSNNVTSITDKYGNTVKVPEGFKLAPDSATDVTGGIVIEDVSHGATAGSQFVWIPIGTVKYLGRNKDNKSGSIYF